MNYKIFRFEGLVAVLNIENGKIAYFNNEINEINLTKIPEFNKFDIKDFTQEDYYVYYLGFNISNKCNLNCKYCFRKQDTRNKVSIEYIKDKIIEFLKNHCHCKKIYIDISGDGEPLLNKALIKQIADLCIEIKSEYKIDVVPMLICNGTLLDKKMVDFLQENLVLFGVSLDGVKEVHDKNRVDIFGNGTYDKISKNLLSIKNNDFVGVSMTLTPLFSKSIVKCYLDMYKHAPTIAIRFKRNICKDDESFFRASYFVKKGYQELIEILIEQIKKDDFKLLFAILNGDDIFAKIFIRVLTGCRIDYPCEGLMGRFTFQDDKIYPCAPASELKIFGCDGFFDQNTDFINTIEKSRQICKKCYAKFYCGGECPIVFHQKGSVDLGLCEIRKELVTQSIRLMCYLLNNHNALKTIKRFIYEKLTRDMR